MCLEGSLVVWLIFGFIMNLYGLIVLVFHVHAKAKKLKKPLKKMAVPMIVGMSKRSLKIMIASMIPVNTSKESKRLQANLWLSPLSSRDTESSFFLVYSETPFLSSV